MPSKPESRPAGGRAVGDEDPDQSPMDGLAAGRGTAQPMDVEQIEKDRAKSPGPRTDEMNRT